MATSQNCIKSLKETLLEYAVLNMNDLFPSDISKYHDASIPTFPMYLFDEIIEMSKDMCWPIRPKTLLSCFAIKDRLKWNEANFFRNADCVRARHLHLYVGKIHKLKTLCVTIESGTEKFFFEISNAAATLEDLKFTVDGWSELMYNNLKESKAKCTQLKLKRLRLDVPRFEYFPYTLDSDKLTVFDLTCSIITESLLETLVSFKRLVTLSLNFVTYEMVNLEDLLNAAASLKFLRAFSLNDNCTYINEIVLNKITNDFKNLDILNLRTISIVKPSLLHTPERKLKVLNYINHKYWSAASESALNGLAQRIGNLKSLDGLMTIMSTTLATSFYSETVRKLFSSISREKIDLKMLAGETFDFRSPYTWNAISHSGACSSSSYDGLRRMICCGWNDEKYRKNRILIAWIIDFVEHNGNTHLAKAFTRTLDAEYNCYDSD